MANQSSSCPILCASFNQDNSGFAISTKDGFKIFDSNTGRLCYERSFGAFIIVEMLYSSSLLAIVGAGEQPSLSPRRLCLFNTATGAPLRELPFLTSILAVRLNRKRHLIERRTVIPLLSTFHRRLLVVLQENTYIYDSNSLAMLDTIDTVPNLKDAHRSPLAAIALSSNGTYIATASEQGTIIRVHLVSEATKSYSFRRGTYPSTIFSLSFAPSLQLPDILAATSSSGSVHIFSLGFDTNQSRSKKSISFPGLILPDYVNHALDPAHRHVLHNAVSAGVRSYAVVRKVDKAADSPEFATCRAVVSLIAYNGYFQEYAFSINNQNESSWSLEREFNLLTLVSDGAETS
ncbi:autophagy-related protein 18b-like isoform X6 [Durio zibethinus]|uniref:Autophagy-related protein 18b-like isoform X6 n=1 Tax=Durio zibethinus TaxID=66656 RepID=A0A6P5XNN9_DURZI|nr:autophagy-related protein 18b-like isoform X6 [Durio zibethinus]